MKRKPAFFTAALALGPATAVLGIALLSWTCAGQENQKKDAGKVEAGKVTAHSRGLHGYIGFSATRPPVRSEYSAGMGFYSAVWPLIDQPLANFQIGLAIGDPTPRQLPDWPAGLLDFTGQL